MTTSEYRDDRHATIAAEVVRAALAMEVAGLVVGTAGNVSARRPDGLIYITPSATPYGDVTPNGLAVIDIDGHQQGSGRPSTEKAMHAACYRAFPEVGGVVHCHPIHGSMFATARRPISPAVEEAIIYVGGEVPVADYAPTGTDELADEVVRHLADCSAVLMSNHGLLCIGSSPADALHTAQVVEHTAHIVFGAILLGGAVALPESVVQSFARMYRHRRSRWTSPTADRALSPGELEILDLA